MARQQKPTKLSPHSKTHPSRKTNAAGYAKRQTLKSKTLGGEFGASDVYEYQPEKVRRSKVKLLLEKDDIAATQADGHSDDGEREEGRAGTGRRPRMVGEDEDDIEIGEDEDEEIDSDAAFEESDEERFAGFSFSHKNKKKTKLNSKSKSQTAQQFHDVNSADVDLNEDEEAGDNTETREEEASEDENSDEEEDGEPDEFIDVLDILDGRGEPESGEDTGDVNHQAQRRTARLDEEASGSEMDKDEEYSDVESAEEPDHLVSESEDEHEIQPAALEHLETFITSLDTGQKRKAPDDHRDSEDATRVRKRRILKERTEAGAENEFAAQSGASKLQLDDLLAPLTTQSSNLLSLKKSAKVLTSSSGASKTLSAPLPQRTQERLDREAAYAQTKEEVDKWKATMRRIKEAEHLSFPLQAQPTGKTSNLELTAKFKPTTEMESAVDKLLKSAKMRDEDLQQTESLIMNNLSIEEVAARRAELAKMRELMFRAEAKAKRIAKIKSKTYRRIKKKERTKLAAKIGDINSEDEEGEEAQLKREVERARERATLRHKNTGKWAKSMKLRGELDVDQRREIGEMLERGEVLRRKIRGERASGDEDASDDDEDNDDEDVEGGIRRIKANAFEEISKVGDAEDPSPGSGTKKGSNIFEMKFMKDAMARDQRRAADMADDFVRELGGHVMDEDVDMNAGTGEPSSSAAVERVGGRVTYRPGAILGSQRPLGSLESDTSSVTLRSTDVLPTAQSPLVLSPSDDRSVDLPLVAQSNPWLASRADGTDKVAQKKHEVILGKNSATAEKSKNKLRKRVKKREEEKEKAKEDAAVEVSLTNVITLTSTNEPGPSNIQSASSAAPGHNVSSTKGIAQEEDQEDDSNSEVDVQENILDRKGKGKAKGVKAFEQRDLVALAFAGDNVVQEFADIKRREMQEDAPREVDTTLPGWGSWGGTGAKKAPPKPHLIKKVAGVDPSKRADYHKAHVIISEKRDKKAAKYMVKDLPYPYTSKAQFERSMDTPLGTEWNTRLGFQRGTLPKVVKKMGTVISPLEKLL